MSRTVSAPNELSLEARRACWDRLWQILLQGPVHDEAEPREDERSREAVEAHDAVERVDAGKEDAMAPL